MIKSVLLKNLHVKYRLARQPEKLIGYRKRVTAIAPEHTWRCAAVKSRRCFCDGGPAFINCYTDIDI